VRFAVILAFADASIVVLALPQIVGQLDTTISHVTWVIMAYNLSLIAGVLGFLAVGRGVNEARILLGGLLLFGVASIGCGVANSLEVLVAFRCVQGVGGGLLLCASLPLLAGASREGESVTAAWAAAAALGAAIGPAAGGVLTQLFDWRAIFIAQAPAAAIAAIAVVAVPVRDFRAVEEDTGERSEADPVTANASLLLLSAGLIGALFLVVVLLIDVWQLEPIEAAAVVTAIPVATFVTDRLGRGRSPIATGIGGALLLAAGLVVIALITHRQVAAVTAALALCGAGLGLAFTTLTAAAMRGTGTALTRAGRTVAARDAGLVVGLLVLTPIFVHDLDKAPGKAIPSVASAVITAPLDGPTKAALAGGLLKVYKETPKGQLPDLDPAFDPLRARSDPKTAAELTAVQSQIESVVEREVTHSFRRAFLYSAGFALLVVPLLGAALLRARRPRPA
jgi:predicted MFS family arabinose efflux permease